MAYTPGSIPPEDHTTAADITAVEVDADELEAQARSRFRLPDVYVILFCFIAVAAIATHLIPAGVYDRVTLANGRKAIDPTTYHAVDGTPAGFVDFLTAIPEGFIAAADIIIFTFIIGGLFAVLRTTGIIEAGIDRLARAMSRQSLLIIPVLMLTFSGIATVIGTQELALVYVPVILPLLIALGFDSVTAAAVALTATSAGFMSGVLNPINTGLGQQIAGLPPFSGLGIRATLWLVITGTAIAYTMWYARRVRNNPAASHVAGEATEQAKRAAYRHDLSATPRPMTTRMRIATGLLLAFFVVLVWGILTQKWFFVEMSGLFIVTGIVVGLVAGLKTGEICESFNVGMRDVLVGAIIVGVARAVAVVLENAQIMDTIVNWLGQAVGGLPAALAAVGMFGLQTVFSFLVSSGSGQALVTMPIMAPLSDVIGVTRQISVLAYQLGDGVSNIIWPTSGYFMATIALAGVRYDKWLKFYLPLYAMWIAIAVVALVATQAVGWNG